MKWRDMTIFYKAVNLTGGICALAYGIVVACYFCDILPSVYELPWAQVIFGTGWVCLGILNMKQHRTSAIINFVTATLAYLTAILGCFL